MADPTRPDDERGSDRVGARGRLPGLTLEFSLLAEVLDDPVMAWSALRSGDDNAGEIVDLVYEYVNPAAVETIGIPAVGLLGQRLLEVLPAHVELGLFDRYRTVAETGIADLIEIPWFEDGNVAGAFEARISRVAGGILCVARNVTGRVLAEQRLSAVEQRLALVLGNTGEAVLHVVDGEVAWASPAIEDVLGVSPSAIVGTRAAAWCHPEAAHLIDRPTAPVPSGPPTWASGRLRRRDGRWEPVEVSTRPADVGVVATLRRPPTPDSAADDLAGVLATLDAVPEAVVVSKGGMLHYGNAAARRLLGLDPDESVRDRRIEQFLDADDLANAFDWADRVRRRGTTDVPFWAWMHLTDRPPTRVEITGSPMPGDPDALILVVRDVTERTRLGDELAESEAAARFLTENSADVLLRVDDQHRVTLASAATVAVLGVAPSDVVGSPIDRIFAPEDRPVVAEALRTAEAAGTADTIELLVPRSGPGESMWVEVEIRCVRLTPDAESAEHFPADHEFHVTLYDVRRERADREALRGNERRLRALLDGAPVGIFELDALGNCTFVNERYCSILGIDGLDDVVGRNWLDRLDADDRDEMLAEWPTQSGSTSPYEREVRFVRPDDRVVRAVVGTVPVVDDEGRVTGWFGTVEDVSERYDLEQSRQEAAELFRAAFDHAPTGLSLMAVDRFPPTLITANTAMLEITGLTERELRDLDFYEISHPDDAPVAAAGRAALLAGEIDTHEMEIRQRYVTDGPYRWYSLVRSVVRDERGRVMHLIAQTTDVTERKETERLHYHMAVTDALTGLSNRRHFDDRLANTHARLLRSAARVGIVFIDLDRFKVINDELGHRAGDEVLQQVAMIIESTIRPGDTAARLGGDEFVLLVEHDDEEELVAMAERLRVAIDVSRPLPQGGRHRVTASIGIASRRAIDCDPDEMMQLADSAMYFAKRDGRHRFKVAESI